MIGARAWPVLLLLLVRPVFGQWDTLALRFHAITIEDGLSQGMVNHIIQDRYGFMWFATKDGLNRYDGYEFTVFRHDPEDSTSLRDNFVHALLEDAEGRLWVGTATGLDLFDRERERFMHIRCPSTREEVGYVLGIEQDDNGDLWLAGSAGLSKLTFDHAPVEDEPLPPHRLKKYHDGHTGLSRTRDGILWGGRYEHFSFRIQPRHDGYDELDTLELDALPNRHGGVSRISKPGLTHVVEDTVRRKRYLIDASRIVDITAGNGRMEVILDMPPGSGSITSSQVVVDHAGRIWFAYYRGFFRFDPATHELVRIGAREHALREAVHHSSVVYQDRTGLIWIGTRGYGLLTYDPRAERFHTVPGPSVGSMAPGRNGQVVISRDAMFLEVYDTRSMSFVQRIPESAFVHHPAMQVRSIWGLGTVQDASGTYWSNYAGLISYRIGDPGPVAHRPQPAVEAERTTTLPLYLDGDSVIWFGGDKRFGRFDRRTGAYSYYPCPLVSIDPDRHFATDLHRDAEGIFWIGTSEGLLRFDATKGEWLHFGHDPRDPTTISAPSVLSVTDDPDDPHVLWLGTDGGGLNRLDKATGRVARFGMVDGLPNNVVYSVMADAAGRLWMSTNKGISRLDPDRKVFRNYDASDGLQSDEFNRNAFCRQSDGTLFFGGVNGFNYFHPRDIVDDSTATPIRITAIRLINRRIDFREDGSPLALPAYLSTGLSIPHSTNMVTFEFASMEYSAPAARRYQYKLEGFDADWIMSGTDRSAVYTNLDPGTYTFRVRGDNRDGVWDPVGASFMLHVLPPWWRTWWFYALCVLGVGGAILLYIRMLTGQKQYLERTVLERTVDLVHAKERAEKSERIKQQFLANMSHEIRTPMNAIVGMSNALRRDTPIDEGTRASYVEAIASSSESLLDIVNEILDLSKIEAGKLEVEKMSMAPRAVLDQVLEVMGYRAEEKGLVLTSRVSPDVPTTVMGDATRLRQVLMNLVSNAIKFTERGSVWITVDVQERLREAVMLRFAVADTGIGIAPDRLARVFDEFTQAESDHTRRFGGTGLGLTICKRLVEMQGGSITAESEPGRGSTFTFSVPFGVDGSGDARPSATPGPAAAEDQPPLHDLRVLLAEDNKLNVLVAQVELEDAIPGVRIDVAGDGARALDMLRSNDYDLVLMDVQMPGMDGYAATRAIRTWPDDKSRIPIIAMTANVMQAEVQQCMDAGMDGFVPKPFTQEELVKAIRKAMVPQDH